MTDLRYALRMLLNNPGFTVRPPQCCRPDRIQFPKCCSRKPGHLRQYCYGGRAVACLCGALACAQRASRRRQAVRTLALGIGADRPGSNGILVAIFELLHTGKEKAATMVERRANVQFPYHRTFNPSRAASREAFGSKLQNASHIKTSAGAT